MNPINYSARIASRALASLLVVFAAACTTVDTASTPSVIERIKTATTRTDHVNIATFYESESRSARQNAVQHRQMAEGYRGRAGVGRGGAELQTSILRHCESLVTQFERAAVEYEGLAELHRRLAEEAGR